MSNPKVSIIAIAYNLEQYIQRCIASLTNQTLKEIEIIVVDDGSIDLTFEKVNEFAKQDDRIQVISQINQGPNSAREAGFKVAKGEYIQFVDGDDWLDLETCEKLYQQAKKDEADVVLFNYYDTYEDDEKLKQYSYKKKQNYSHPFKEFVTGGYFSSICLKLISRSFLIYHNFKFPESITYAEDNAFTGVLFLLNPKIALLSDHLYYYLQRSGSAIANTKGYLEDADKVFGVMEESLQTHPLKDDLLDYYQLYIFNHLTGIYGRAIKQNQPWLAKKAFKKLLTKKVKIPPKFLKRSKLYAIYYGLFNLAPPLFNYLLRIKFIVQK